MKTLIPALLALASFAASAQGSDAPVTMRLYSVPASERLGAGLDAGPGKAKLGLRVDTGQWHFDLAVPDTQAGLSAPVSARGFVSSLSDLNIGVSRSFGSSTRDGSFWDLGNLSVVASAGYGGVVRPVDESYRSLWSGSLGAAWKFSSASSLGLNYRIEASPLPEVAALRSLGVSYGYQFTSGLRLSTNLGYGLSDGAPKWGGGLSITFSH